MYTKEIEERVSIAIERNGWKTEQGYRSIDRIRELIDPKSQVNKDLKAFLKFIDSCKFKVGDAVIFEGENYLVNNIGVSYLTTSLVNGQLNLDMIRIQDHMGKVRVAYIDQLTKLGDK